MNSTLKTVIVVGIVVLAIFYLESRKPDVSEVGEGESTVDVVSLVSEDRKDIAAKKLGEYDAAVEISTPDAFINTESITVSELIGKQVILVDFWTYSCINCQRTLPFLNRWHETYGDKGLTILGVHTPEFEFEKDLGNVQQAVDKFGVAYPVILDNDFSTWRAYNNRFWPRKYIIDIDGAIVYDHIGEGGYDETEKVIKELLTERAEVLGETFDASAIATDMPEEENLSGGRTPEIYFGSSRVQNLTNLPAVMCYGRECDFEAPTNLSLHAFILDGPWTVEEEYAEFTGGSDEGAIVLRFYAKDVNLVAESVGGSEVEVLLDGETLSSESRGVDVAGNGTVSVGAAGLYNLVDLDTPEEHVLTIRGIDTGLKAFTFTFG